ncbi:MAG: trehalose-phosphatase [Thermoanaerobaculia bacterium]
MNLGPTLLAFDCDGALAPLRTDPEQSRMDRVAALLVRRAGHLPGITVAVVSGRDAGDVASRIDAPGVYVVGSHGLEIRAPGGECIRDAPALTAEIPDSILSELELSGLRIEWKKHAIALHWRGIPAEAIEPVIDQFRSWALRADLDIIDGSCVVEARCRGDRKAEALQWLMRVVGASRLIYAAHDAMDVAALRFAAEKGRAVSVAPHEGPIPAGVIPAESFRHLFRIVRQEVLL